MVDVSALVCVRQHDIGDNALDQLDVLGGDHFAPVAVHARDAELFRHALARFLRAIGHRHQLHAGLGPELGNVVEPCVLAGAYEPHADLGVSHGSPW